MKALIDKGHGEIALEERPMPVIQEQTDAIVRVTRSSICSSDLHIIHGTVPRARENIVLGHEFTGEIVETGAGVKRFKMGDRVSVNVETFCGECYFCKRGYVNNCVHGGWELGCRIDGMAGGKAEWGCRTGGPLRRGAGTAVAPDVREKPDVSDGWRGCERLRGNYGVCALRKAGYRAPDYT